MNRPLNGLVHIQSFSEDIEFEKFYDEENEKWHILFQIWRTDQIKKKMISGKVIRVCLSSRFKIAKLACLVDQQDSPLWLYRYNLYRITYTGVP